MKYELYGNEDGYSFLPENHSQKELITEDEVLIWTAEAETWQEACFKRNEYLGWNPYRPMCPYCKNDMTYGEECCEECQNKKFSHDKSLGMDPVFYDDGSCADEEAIHYGYAGPGWYFYDEVWQYQNGPYRSQEEANKACIEYARNL